MSTTFLTHSKIQVALHELRGGEGRPLLLLHGLGEHSPEVVPDVIAAAWPGPVQALDFTGHGQTTVPHGGGYTCELLMGDVDIALAHVGPSTVLGRGLGAYVALLIAGARPRLVVGAMLHDGPGLAGGGTGPASPSVVSIERDEGGVPDPFALAELTRDVRPADYATSFARQATQLSTAPFALTVTAIWRPAWLEAVADEPGVAEMSLPAALASYAKLR